VARTERRPSGTPTKRRPLAPKAAPKTTAAAASNALISGTAKSSASTIVPSEGPLRPNNIVFDAEGGFWFTDLGSMGEREVERGRICYAKADGSMIRDAVVPMLPSNGIGLSPDRKALYAAETLTARIWAFDVVAPGRLALKPWPALTPGTMLYGAGEYCMCDLLALEAQGSVCVTTIGAPGIARIIVISPQGE
jgi:gluconolactonase